MANIELGVSLGTWLVIGCHFSWIYVLSIGEIRGELQVLHGVDDHDFVHLIHDILLVENLM